MSGLAPGSYAAATVAPAARPRCIPEAVSDEQAAAVLFQGTKARYLLHGTDEIRPGDV